MRIPAALAAVLAIAVAGAAVWYLDPFSSDQGDEISLEDLQGELTGSACRRVAGFAARLAERDSTPLTFLRDFGRDLAGIRPPPRGYGDLARGGRNRLPGRGFLARYDDGTQGQARHFAGIAVATTFVGGASPTRWISEHLRDDPDNSADGRLTDEGIEFAHQVLSGDLPLDETPEWLLDNLCRRR